MLEGLPDLRELNMYGNKVSAVVVPQNPRLLSKLETLDLGYNDLAYIPEELDQLKSLRTLKVMNNFLEKIPMRVCDMELKTIDVSSNPVIQPPIETCERGICSMKRYYQCLRMEEQSKQKALEALQSKAALHSSSKKGTPKVQKKTGGGGVGMLKKSIGRIGQSGMGRKTSDESANSAPNQEQATPNHSASDLKANVQAPFRSVSLQDPVSGAPKSVTPLSSDTLQQKSKSLSAVEKNDNRIDDTMVTHRSASLEEPAVYAKKESWTSSGDLKGPDLIDMTGTPEDSITKISDHAAEDLRDEIDQVTVNDTLKVIFVGMAMAGKTSMIKRLIEGENAVIPKRDQRTIGVDIYEWDPKTDRRFEHIDNRIQLQDKELEEVCGDVSVKFSVWDFAGQHVYHATHQLFFSPRALYVLVWDMGATNKATKVRKGVDGEDDDAQGGAFSLTYDSDSGSDSEDDDFISEEESRRADRALERDIDEKVQFWVDCIQSSAPGSAILPVASFDDLFPENNHAEAKRRCDMLKHRLLRHEERRIQGIKDRLKEYEEQNRANDESALRLRKLLGSYIRPKFIFGGDGEDSVIRVSGLRYTGFAALTEKINNIATGRDKANYRYPIFRGHVGARIPRMRLEVLDAVRGMRDRFKVVEWGYFISELRNLGLTHVEDISDALHFLTNIGELSYFGGILPESGQSSRRLIPTRDSATVRDLSTVAFVNSLFSFLSEISHLCFSFFVGRQPRLSQPQPGPRQTPSSARMMKTTSASRSTPQSPLFQ
jgi:GTPase SAR1 family protein